MKFKNDLFVVFSIAGIRSKYLPLFLFLFTAGFSAPAMSATWICGDGDWNTNTWPAPTCWDWYDYPDAGEDVYIVDTIYADAKTVNYINPGYDPSLRYLYIESLTGGTTTLTQAQDDLTTDASYVGISNGGKGAYTQSGGTHTTNYFVALGSDTGSHGVYTLSGGALTAGDENIGYDGTGVFNQSGGSNTITRDLFLGFSSNSLGTYNLSAAATLSAKNEYIGYNGSGSFTHSGGTHTVENSLTIGGDVAAGASGNGSYDLSGSTAVLTVGADEFIGNAGGTGTFTQSGGLHEINGSLILGNGPGSSGSYDLSGGSLSATLIYTGYGGNGTFTQTGGTLNTLGEVISYNSTFRQSAGTHTVTELLYAGNPNMGLYILTQGIPLTDSELLLGAGIELSGGTLTTDTEKLGSGIFIQNGGVHKVNNVLELGTPFSFAGYILRSGTLEIAGSLNTYAPTWGIAPFGSGNILVSGGSAFYIDGRMGEDWTVVGDTLNNLAFSYFGVGLSQGSSATYRMPENSTLSAKTESIGLSSDGLFEQATGSNTAGDLIVGFNSTGHYTLSGSGSLTATNEVIGHLGNSSGTFTQDGGTNTANHIALAYDVDSTGMYYLYDGKLTAENEIIGRNGTGTFIQTGGNHIVNDTMALGDINNSTSNSIGTYSLEGGTLNAHIINTEIFGSSHFSFTGGTLSVDTYIGNLVNNGGTLAPGNSPGVTTIEGGYSQDINSTLMIELGGLLSGDEYDVLNVTGTASLDGLLDVSLYDWGSGIFAPSKGDAFDILTADSIVGEFDLLLLAALGEGLEWELSYILDDFNIDILRLSVKSAVPVPPSVWLFSTGIIGLTLVARRNNRA